MRAQGGLRGALTRADDIGHGHGRGTTREHQSHRGQRRRCHAGRGKLCQHESRRDRIARLRAHPSSDEKLARP